MSFFNGSAIAVMFKSMFPAVFARVEELEEDGTIERLTHVLRTMAENGTAEQLIALSSKLDEHNRLLTLIAQGHKADGYFTEPGSDTGNAEPVLPYRIGVLGAVGAD